MNEVYISVDIETDGPIPGENSMLSFGAASFIRGKPDPLGTFYINLKTLEGATADPDTMKFWADNPEAYAATQINKVAPAIAMDQFRKWVKEQTWVFGERYNPVLVAYPAGFDFLFMYWYLIKFGKDSPFSFSALDIKSYAMAVMKTPFRETVKKNMPRKWFGKKHRHTHVAIDDAIGQGVLFMNMLEENLGKS